MDMNASSDFSRRFFADFIASRVKAWTLEEGKSRPASRPHAPGAAEDPARAEARPADAIDRRGLLPGLGSSGV
jgi:hypothetical protein